MTTASRPALYPLRLREILRDYPFGGRWIAGQFAKEGLPANHRLAETWEVCDRPGESSQILNGPLAGATLAEAIDRFGAQLLGQDIVNRFGRRFPLLIKLLDATHPLGEQVHPDDELTRAWGLEDFSGKAEAWYMLHVRPGARVYCGNRPGVTMDALREAVLAGQSRQCMVEQPVSPGDAFLLYAGTMHYSPGGVLFYEIMQNSDVYVGLREPPLNLSAEERRQQADRALQAVRLETNGFNASTRPVALTLGPNTRTFILACEHFALERLDLAGPYTLDPAGRRFHVLTLIEGEAVVTCGPHAETLRTGSSCLVPATTAVRIEPHPRAAILDGYVPDLAGDIVLPLTQSGIAAEAIVALGGDTALNPLRALVS